jgi:hypothetical protein
MENVIHFSSSSPLFCVVKRGFVPCYMQCYFEVNYPVLGLRSGGFFKQGVFPQSANMKVLLAQLRFRFRWFRLRISVETGSRWGQVWQNERKGWNGGRKETICQIQRQTHDGQKKNKKRQSGRNTNRLIYIQTQRQTDRHKNLYTTNSQTHTFRQAVIPT